MYIPISTATNIVCNYFGMREITINSQVCVLAGGHRAFILFVPPSLGLLQPCLGVPLHERVELLCLNLTTSVGSINLIVLARAVQSFDENGCVFVIAVYLMSGRRNKCNQTSAAMWQNLLP